MIPLLPIVGPWLVKRVGAKAAPIVQALVLLALFAIVIALIFNKDDHADQIGQTTRSAAAVADAAEDAISTLEGRTATEDAIDQATQEALSDIATAPDADAVHAAVLAAVCATPEHRNDPACL